METRAARIDDRDRRLLELLAEHRVAALPHVEALLGVSRSAAQRRVRALARWGYLRCEQIFAGQPPTLWITRLGIGAVECPLPAPRPDLKGYRHDLGVAWLWLAARDGAFGPLSAQHSERSMRSADRRMDLPGPAKPFGVGLGAGGREGRRTLHYPDLILEPAGGRRIAVELELTAKSRRRLDAIMLGYACDGRIDAVLYLCPTRHIGGLIEDAARRAGIGGIVHVQRLASRSPHGVAGLAVSGNRSVSTSPTRPGVER